MSRFCESARCGGFPIVATDEGVIELLSPSDKLAKIQEKMQEYLDNGMQLGWLINPQSQQVEIYRQGKQVEIQDRPDSLSAKSVLPEFNLDLQFVW